MRKIDLCLVIGVGLASTAFSQVTYTEQERIISAGETITAPDFGPFDVSTSFSEDTGGMFVPASGSASQLSILDPDQIIADCQAGASGGAISGASTTSVVDVEFVLAAPTTVTFSGFVSGAIGGIDPPGFSIASGAVSLRTGAGTSIASWSSGDAFQQVEFGPTELEPGAYSIRVVASAFPGAQEGGGTGNAELIATFSARCAADLTNDGIADLADIQLFIESFVAQEPAGDFNTDGIYDLADIQAFVAAFVAGCP